MQYLILFCLIGAAFCQFNTENCGSVITINDASESCALLMQEYMLDESTFFRLNPDIDCQNLRLGMMVCVEQMNSTSEEMTEQEPMEEQTQGNQQQQQSNFPEMQGNLGQQQEQGQQTNLPEQGNLGQQQGNQGQQQGNRGQQQGNRGQQQGNQGQQQANQGQQQANQGQQRGNEQQTNFPEMQGNRGQQQGNLGQQQGNQGQQQANQGQQRGNQQQMQPLTGFNRPITRPSRPIRQRCLRFVSAQAGDTCYNIWIRAGLTSDEFFSLNRNVNCQNLLIGDRLCVEGSGMQQRNRCAFSVNVENGDTCFGIWQRAGISRDQFFALNPRVDCNLLQIGSPVCIA